MSILLVMCLINLNSAYFPVLEKGISLYNGLYQSSSNTQFFSIFIISITFVILSLNSYFPRKVDMSTLTEIYNTTNTRDSSISGNEANENNKNKLIGKTESQFKILEYSLLILFIICGAIFLISTNDLISIFISIELQSYGLYLLSTVYRNSELSTRAGLTYFLLGGLSSCIVLLSQGLLYINSGSTNIEYLYILSNIPVLDKNILYNICDQLYSVYYIHLSLIILSVGFLFKVSAAPFHFWSPDVYDGVPTLVTTFIAIIAKISIFIFLLELVHFTINSYAITYFYTWNNNLLVSSLLSLTIGAILGLTQSRIKRLYAYSTISHVGFILLSLSINSTESIQAFVFYIIQYSISNLNAFIILISIGYFIINYYNTDKIYNNLKEKNNSPIQMVIQLKGFYKLNGLLALSLGITLFSFLGVPPLLGFFGKQMVLSASLDSGYIFMSLVAILTSVISAAYYLVVVKHIFFDENKYINIKKENSETVVENNLITLSGFLTGVVSVLTLLMLIFIFSPNESLNLTKVLCLFIFSV